ncbi:hypothetical protein [Halobaculum sp. MBLA0143]|uniref:hypothetical protein n=1 Tax=Halobaculum sp. MBLA0143 TaxID=3079933 RepID=UPI0035257E12
MSEPSFLEDPLLSTVDSEVQRAATEIEGVSTANLDPITRQKLILYTVRQFGVEAYVTTQWYLHGDVAVKGKADNRAGNATLDLPTGVDSDIPTQDEIFDELTGDSREYVHEALSAETFEWLGDYYRERSIPFEDVYRAALPLYAALHRTRDAAMGAGGEVPDDLSTTVETSCGALKRALSRYALFDGIQPYVTEFARAAEPFVGWIERHEWDNSPVEHYDEFDRLYELFYDGVWRGCGQRMSYVTVEGPSADDTKARRRREASGQRELFEAKLGQFQMAVDGLGVAVEATTDRLPNLEFDDYVEEAGVEPDILAGEQRSVPDDDPLFEVVE